MALRFRLLGILIFACGAAFCRGAFLLWPTSFEPGFSSLAIAALQIAMSAVAAVLGILNVVAGAVVMLKPARV